MEDGTYEISLFRRFFSKDWLMYPGKLSFRCFIIVVSTTWRKGIHHKLFGDPGCPNSPPNVPNGYYNITSGDATCWNTPKEGSRIRYNCNSDYELLGPESMMCKNGSWKSLPSAKYLLSDEYGNDDDRNTDEDDQDKIITSRGSINYGRQVGFATQAKKFKESRSSFIPRGPLITVCNSSPTLSGQSIKVSNILSMSPSSIFSLSSSSSSTLLLITLCYNILIYFCLS